MTKIKTEHQYNKAVERIEELLLVVGNDTSPDDKDFVELDLLSELVADYEAVHYPVRKRLHKQLQIDANLIWA